jgi:signal transduction histidine kinase
VHYVTVIVILFMYLFIYISFYITFIILVISFYIIRFSKVTERFDIYDIGNEDEKIKGLIQVVITVTVSLRNATDLHDTIFQRFVFESLHIHCMSITQ